MRRRVWNAETRVRREKRNHEAHERRHTKVTKKTKRATARGAGYETKSASQTQTRCCSSVCVCESLSVSLAAGCAGRRRARTSAGSAVSAFKLLSFSCSSCDVVLDVFVFSWSSSDQ